MSPSIGVIKALIVFSFERTSPNAHGVATGVNPCGLEKIRVGCLTEGGRRIQNEEGAGKGFERIQEPEPG